VFGRRRREENDEARNALAQAVARLEQGLEEQGQTHAVTAAAVQELNSTVFETRNDLIETVEYLYSVCSVLLERTESEQRELQALIETMRELARPTTIELDPPRERVLGGSFPATTPEIKRP
jgi:hypothetical protein